MAESARNGLIIGHDAQFSEQICVSCKYKYKKTENALLAASAPVFLSLVWSVTALSRHQGTMQRHHGTKELCKDTIPETPLTGQPLTGQPLTGHSLKILPRKVLSKVLPTTRKNDLGNARRGTFRDVPPCFPDTTRNSNQQVACRGRKRKECPHNQTRRAIF